MFGTAFSLNPATRPVSKSEHGQSPDEQLRLRVPLENTRYPLPCLPEFGFSSPHPTKSNQRLPGGGPDVLDVTVTLSEAVDAVVRLAHGADETAKGVGLVLAGVASVLINLCDGDLDGTVILGSDDAVGGAALARDVKVDELSAFVLHFG